MVYLHAASPPVLHKDLKAGNVLVDDKFRAKITDFGLSMKGAKGMIGTPFWMAPELLRGEKHTTKTDVYAFAILLFELFSREEPFETDDVEHVLKLVADMKLPHEYRPHSDEMLGLPHFLNDLMLECWNKNPLRRPSFQEISQRVQNLDVKDLEQFFESSASRWVDNTNRDRDLLHQVFPAHIADALKEGKKVDPEQHDCVTIFFSDIVGFTNISQNLQPMQVMNMLDRLYRKLDRLAKKHEVFKVETIGDAYMAVSNLIYPQPDHCVRICRFAIEAIRAANQTRVLEDVSLPVPPEVEEFVHLRAGFHSGPVVASVVGSLNPRFCLFGDTVNTASRMESTSNKDFVHLSESSAQLFKEQTMEDSDIVLESRGIVTVKGKGVMNTYWAVQEFNQLSHQEDV